MMTIGQHTLQTPPPSDTMAHFSWVLAKPMTDCPIGKGDLSVDTLAEPMSYLSTQFLHAPFDKCRHYGRVVNLAGQDGEIVNLAWRFSLVLTE